MIRVVARGKTGTVILRDSRPDGSYVLLQCEEFTPSGNGGVLALPDAEKDEEFPMLLTYAHRRTAIHAERTGTMPFSLEVDISGLPPGELRFRNREFIEQAAHEAEIADRTEITPENADRWGWVSGELGAT